MSERWGALPLGERLPSGDGWKGVPPDQPRISAGCGQKVTRNACESIWFETSAAPTTWHVRCRPRWAKR